MKRSQIVERIYDLLNCDGVLEYSMPKIEPVPLTEEHVRWIAEQIVQEIEQVKTIKIYHETSFGKHFNLPEGDPEFNIRKVNVQGWEPEDEKK